MTVIATTSMLARMENERCVVPDRPFGRAVLQHRDHATEVADEHIVAGTVLLGEEDRAHRVRLDGPNPLEIELWDFGLAVSVDRPRRPPAPTTRPCRRMRSPPTSRSPTSRTALSTETRSRRWDEIRATGVEVAGVHHYWTAWEEIEQVIHAGQAGYCEIATG